MVYNHTGPNSYLVLVTLGGGANAGYRIARAFGHHYPDDFRLMIPDVCKSAGTLVAIGANELIVSDRGELGPLDVQFRKKDELFEASSGLDILQSLSAIQDQVMAIFRDYLLDISLGSGLGTKITAQLSSEMACKIVAPITSQIDPMRLGEQQRALRVATRYGERLAKKFRNTSQENIDTLLTGYPSHSFVIDRKEASELFTKVRAPNDAERNIEVWLRARTNNFSGLGSNTAPVVACLNDLSEQWQSEPPPKEESHEQETTAEPALDQRRLEPVGKAVSENSGGSEGGSRDPGSESKGVLPTI
ncbi:SDH family Clp fold serine proteinase [Candidatus Thiosymbion oneisti]|uniref:SDH family Clp fold serine proteinase n=1 Tax=Candidatus Thiosymbion oneisti TaxID=589554 RepID=UPI001AAD454F|nr:hypothetical protein [Candidatus Thiosymbion oneisti]